jgi:hypothetical protein
VKALESQGAVVVRSGQHHTLVLTKDGGLLSFGRPTYGRLGQKDADVGADAACPEPRPVDGLEGVRVAGAAAGLAVSGCFDEAGAGWLWGFGTSNQLGKGDDDEGALQPRQHARQLVRVQRCGGAALRAAAPAPHLQTAGAVLLPCATAALFCFHAQPLALFASMRNRCAVLLPCRTDEVVPKKLAETKKFAGQKIIQVGHPGLLLPDQT